MKQEMKGWQWHQLDHMQIICISLQTVNHASTSSLITFRVSHRRQEMYSGHARLCVCLSLSPSLQAHSTAQSRM